MSQRQFGERSGGAQPRGHRVFFALWPDAQIVARLTEVARRAKALHGGRLMRPDTLHVTLAFVGQVDDAELKRLGALAESLCCPELSLPIEQAVVWAHNHICWCGPRDTPEALFRFSTSLRQRLETEGFPMERRPFQAHVTLLRNVPPCTKRESVRFEPFSWKVNAFALMESLLEPAGARYRLLKRWPAAAEPLPQGGQT